MPMSDITTDSPPPEARQRSSRSLVRSAIAIVLLMTVIFAAANMARRWRGTEQPAMRSLAEFVMETGKPAWIPARCLQYFGVPPGELGYRELKAVSQSGRTKAVQVRKRPESGIIDVFFLDLLPNDTRGNFFLTSTHGRLTKAAFFDIEPSQLKHADEEFDEQKRFWFLWQREKMKWAAKQK